MISKTDVRARDVHEGGRERVHGADVAKDSVKTEPARAHTVDSTRRGPGRPPNPKPAETISAAATPQAAAPAPVVPVLGPDFADTSLKFLGGTMALLATTITGVPFETCERVLGFSEPQRKMLSPTLAPVLDKYVGEWIRTHQSEMALIMLATPIVTANLMTFAAIAREHKRKVREEKNRAPKAVSASAPMPAPPSTSQAAGAAAPDQVM